MDEAGSRDNLHERFEVKRINHNLYSLSRGIPHSRASKRSSFTRRPQAGYCRRKLTTSGGASRFRNFREALSFLPNIRELTRV